jgi:hypothetical protein
VLADQVTHLRAGGLGDGSCERPLYRLVEFFCDRDHRDSVFPLFSGVLGGVLAGLDVAGEVPSSASVPRRGVHPAARPLRRPEGCGRDVVRPHPARSRRMGDHLCGQEERVLVARATSSAFFGVDSPWRKSNVSGQVGVPDRSPSKGCQSSPDERARLGPIRWVA